MSSSLRGAPQKIKVTVFGEAYTLVTDEQEALVKESAQAVDALMSEMAKKLGHEARLAVEPRKLAVLAAIQFATMRSSDERKVAAKVQDLIQHLEIALH